MTESVEAPRISYQVPFDDRYINTMIDRYYGQRPFLLRPAGQALALSLAFAGYGALVAFNTGDARTGEAFAATGLVALAIPILVKLGLRLRFKMDLAYGKQIEMALTDSGVTRSSARSTREVPWTAYAGAVHYADGYLLLRRGVINWLPNSALTHESRGIADQFIRQRLPVREMS